MDQHLDGSLTQKKTCRGFVKTPNPFTCIFFFTRYRFFLWSFNFPSAGFAPWSKNSHEGGKGKGLGREKEGKGTKRKGRGKGKGKEKEKERKRKGKGKGKENKRKRKGKGKDKEKTKKKDRKKERKGRGKGEEKEEKTVPHTDHVWCQKLSCSLSFCYRSWILRTCLFFWKWLQS